MKPSWTTWLSFIGMRPPFALYAALLASPLAAQDSLPRGDPITNDGIERASIQVDAVFIDRLVPETVVQGGAWGSYLMARLGVVPIPDDLRFRIAVDTSHLEMFGTIADLPLETRQVLAPILGFFPPETMVVARIEMRRLGEEVVDFRLAAVNINGVDFPEGALARVLTQIGTQYPVLTKTGRNLLVRIPKDGDIKFEEGGVRLRIVEPE